MWDKLIAWWSDDRGTYYNSHGLGGFTHRLSPRDWLQGILVFVVIGLAIVGLMYLTGGK